MRNGELQRRAGLSVMALALSGFLGGCAAPEDELAPPFPEGSGQDAPNVAPYPGGPYGVSVGSTIANYKFVGLVNSMQVRDSLQEVRLSDFYNPTGDAVYSEDPREAQYGVDAPKPKALLVIVSSVWCAFCNIEADEVLPAKYQEYKAQGGEFVLQLADGPTRGKPAGQQELLSWTDKYSVDYPTVIDPTYKLGALFDADAYPANMIIDPRDMSVVEVIAGSPTDGFWNTFEEVLARPAPAQ